MLSVAGTGARDASSTSCPANGRHATAPGPANPETDVLAALDRWVEQGVGPERIVASRTNPARTRPLCPYPLKAVYKGSGSTDEAANFSCAAG